MDVAAPSSTDVGASSEDQWRGERLISEERLSATLQAALRSLIASSGATRLPVPAPALLDVFRTAASHDRDGFYVLTTADLENGKLYWVGESTFAVEQWAEDAPKYEKVWVAVSLPFDRETPIFDRLSDIPATVREIRRRRREAFFAGFPRGRDLTKPGAIPDGMDGAADAELRQYCHYTERLFFSSMTHDDDDDNDDADYDSMRAFFEPVYEAELRGLRKLAAGGRLEAADLKVAGANRSVEEEWLVRFYLQ